MRDRRNRTSIGIDVLESIQTGRITKKEILRKLQEGEALDKKVRANLEPRLEVNLHELRGRALRVYEVQQSQKLYDLSDLGRFDVIRVGRHPEQDLQVLDSCASREHGLVVYAGALILYSDYGTLRDGQREGSLNGTWIDGTEMLRDHTVAWHSRRELMIGTVERHHGHRMYKFKLSYRWLPN